MDNSKRDNLRSIGIPKREGKLVGRRDAENFPSLWEETYAVIQGSSKSNKHNKLKIIPRHTIIKVARTRKMDPSQCQQSLLSSKEQNIIYLLHQLMHLIFSLNYYKYKN